MRRLMLLVGAVAVVAASAVVAGASGSAGSVQGRWVIRDLGKLFGNTSWATLTEQGLVVVRGSGYFLWQNGYLRELPVPPGPSSSRVWVLPSGRLLRVGKLGTGGAPGGYGYPQAINDRGQIVGYGSTDEMTSTVSYANHALLWQNGEMTDLGTLGGVAGDSYAVAINERGQVVGKSETKSGQSHAFLWQKGRMFDLGTLPGRIESSAVAINERGQIVGSSGGRAFLWEKGRMRDLGTLGGFVSEPADINDVGLVVGWSQTKTKTLLRHAFLWQNGNMVDLGTLPGAKTKQSDAMAINNHGQILGWSSAKTAQSHSVLWTPVKS